MDSGDTYVSPAVRQFLATPVEGEQIRLRITLSTDEDLDQFPDLIDTIQAAGGSIEEELPYSTIIVSIPEPGVEVLCGCKGVQAIETAAVISMDGDAGEDVDFQMDDESTE